KIQKPSVPSSGLLRLLKAFGRTASFSWSSPRTNCWRWNLRLAIEVNERSRLLTTVIIVGRRRSVMQRDTQSTALRTSQWFRRNLKWIGILAFLFLAGLVLWRLGVGFSSLSGDEKQALEMVELFHERMNAGHFDEVYDDAHPAFRDAESR